MPAQTVNLLIEQGATFSRTFVLRQADGQPVNLTGWTGRGQIRRTQRDETIVAEFTVLISDATGGAFSIGLAPTVTREMNIKSGVFDVELVDAVGGVLRVIQGQVEVSPEVTR